MIEDLPTHIEVPYRLRALLFLELFTELRQEGMGLDISQYQLFLEILQHRIVDFKAPTEKEEKEQLYSLCQSLWLTHEKHHELFRRIFEKHYRKWTRKTLTQKDNSFPEAISPFSKFEESEPDSDVHPLRQASTLNIHQAVIYWKQTPVYLDTANDDQHEKSDKAFFFSDTHFPFNIRQLQHKWRYLRNRAQKYSSEKVDVVGSIMKTIKTAGFPQIEYIPRYHFEKRFIFLIDVSRSMVAFNHLSDQLINSLKTSLSPAKLDTFYFSDVPKEWLFTDRFLTQGIKKDKVLEGVDQETIVLIVSDGGAARGRNHEHRIKDTMLFLDRLKSQTQHVLWINPISRNRWVGTSVFLPINLTENIAIDEMDNLPNILKHL